jgi:hypothetical protein
MEKRCEVCESFRPQGDLKAGRELVEVSFGDHQVLLCRAHAGIAKNSEVTSFQELRALYAESKGQRSYLSRRSRSSHSALNRPRSVGRRATDTVRS